MPQLRSPFLLTSLERKLPVLIAGLIAVVVLSTLLLVEFELHGSAVNAMENRLARISAQLAELVDRNVEQRNTALRTLAAQPALHERAAGEAVPDSVVAAALARFRLGPDAGLPVQLRSLSGSVLASIGAPAPADAAAEGASSHLPAFQDDVAFGPLYNRDGTGAYWVSVPLMNGGEPVGYVVQLRSVGSRAAAEQIEQLIDVDSEIHFAQAGGTLWAALDGGVREDAPVVTTPGEQFAYTRPDGREYFAFAVALGSSDRMLVLEVPESAALASMQQVTRRILIVGLILLLLGGIAAWLLSRSVIAPLRRLSDAADAIAAGDYSRRAALDRADEIGALARTFDIMAERVEATHRELKRRYAEAQSLTAELEAVNAQLHRAIDEAELARLEAHAASRAKSEFLATMSHEIRTPINAMIGYADLMELGVPGPVTEQQANYLGRVRQSGEHLISVVNDVLDFAKLESGQMRILRETRPAPAAIDATVAMLQGRADERRITLHTHCSLDALYLGDAQRVQQILLNLLSNALKFTGAGGRVTISCERRESRGAAGEDTAPSSWTCISVRDTGPGIAPDQHAQIFEPFVQGTGGYTRPHGGTGLGLAISRSLARMMGGDLTLDSQPGRGATFTIWLPHPASAAVAAR